MPTPKRTLLATTGPSCGQISRWLTAASLSAVMLSLSPGSAHAQLFQAVYELPTLGGSTSSAYGITNNIIVGSSINASGATHGAAWRFSTTSPYPVITLNTTYPQDLPPISGYSSSIAYAVNGNDMRIVGASTSSAAAVTHATAWAQVLRGADTPPWSAFDVHPVNGLPSSDAHAVTTYSYTNQNPATSGYGYSTYGNIYGGTYSATSTQSTWARLWTPTPPIIESGVITSGPNDVGQLANSVVNGGAGNSYVGPDTLVGTMWNDPNDPNSQRAFCRYLVSQYIPITNPSPTPYFLWEQMVPNVYSGATGITSDSASGTKADSTGLGGLKTACGWMQTANGLRAFIWQKQGGPQTPGTLPSPGSAPVLTTLPTLGGATQAWAIQHSASTGVYLVVGQSMDPSSNQHAFLYYSHRGMVDLNSLLPANSGWTLTTARGCYEIQAGTWLIVGEGKKLINGVTYTRGFMLVVSGINNAF